MSRSDTPRELEGSIAECYVFDVGILEVRSPEDDGPRYRFEAPEHEGAVFEDLETARLYADVYFDVNGFVEAGTGDRGVPPAVVQGGLDTVAAYLLTRPHADRTWVASFFGRKPEKVARYVATVRERAEEIREGVRERDLDDETA
jgi:hypothetical protein